MNNREKHVVDHEKEVDTSRMVSSISLGPTTSEPSSSLDPTSPENIHPCITLDPTSISLDSTTQDPPSIVDLAIVDLTSSKDCTNLDPTSTSCLEDIEVSEFRDQE